MIKASDDCLVNEHWQEFIEVLALIYCSVYGDQDIQFHVL